MNLAENVTRRDCVGLLILVLMVFWFSHEVIWGGKVPFFRDLGTYFYPMRFTLAESYKAGQLPLWDRRAAMGFPLLADFQSGAFYPPHLFLFFFPFFFAIRTIFVFHYLIAISGTYMLCRQWKYTAYQALIGAILFTLGGTVVSLTNLLNHFQAAVWLPWSIFFWNRFLYRSSWANFVILSFFLLIQFLAGSPEIYVMSMGLLLLEGLAVQTVKHKHRYTRPFYMLIAANFIVALLAMAQLLPTIELYVESRRQEPIPYPEAARWSLNPLSLVNLVFLDKAVTSEVSTGTQLFMGREIPFFVSYYFGIFFLFGICLWFFYSSGRERVILCGLVMVSLFLAFGNFTPIYPFLFQNFSLFRLFRYPEKFFFLTQAFLLFMALRGSVTFFESDHKRSNKALILLASVCLLLFFFYIFLRFRPGPLLRFLGASTGISLGSSTTLDNAVSVLVSLERQLALTTGLLTLFFVGKKGYLRMSLLKILIVAIVFIDLNGAHQSYQFLLKPDFVIREPKILSTPDPEPNRLFYYPPGQNLHPNYFSILSSPSFGEVYSFLFSNLLPNTGIFNGFNYMQDINALGKKSYVDFLKFAHQSDPGKRFRLLGALNVKYIVSFRPLAETEITLVRDFPQYPSWLYAVDDLVPRSYVAAETEVEKNPKEILERLSTVDFDVKRTVILDRPLSLPSNKNFQAQAKIVRYENQSVIIQASLNSPGVLVLADSYYPGWKAYVNGKEEEILRANLFFRAIPLPAGEHTVEFRYEPLFFKIGLIISLMTVFGLVIGSIVHYTVKRKRSLPIKR